MIYYDTYPLIYKQFYKKLLMALEKYQGFLVVATWVHLDHRSPKNLKIWQE